MGQSEADARPRDAPNHFLDSLAEPSMTSRMPGLSASIEGTWLARLVYGKHATEAK